MTVVTVDVDTTAVTVEQTSPANIIIETGPGNPTYYQSVVQYVNDTLLLSSRTLPTNFTMNQLTQVVLAIIEDLYTAGLFTPVLSPTVVTSGTVIYS